MACSAEVYHRSAKDLPSRVATYDYPSHFLVRRVSRCGTIRVLHNQIFVSQVLNEDYVGLEEVDDGFYDLYFCFYLLGRYELRGNRILDIISKVPTSNSRVEGPNRVSPMSLDRTGWRANKSLKLSPEVRLWFERLGRSPGFASRW
jgi:hypothetical protein